MINSLFAVLPNKKKTLLKWLQKIKQLPKSGAPLNPPKLEFDNWL